MTDAEVSIAMAKMLGFVLAPANLQSIVAALPERLTTTRSELGCAPQSIEIRGRAMPSPVGAIDPRCARAGSGPPCQAEIDATGLGRCINGRRPRLVSALRPWL